MKFSKWKYACTAVTGLITCIAGAQDFSFTATVNKTAISSSETLQLTLTLANANGKVALPQLNDWQLTRNMGSRTNTTIINGAFSMSTEQTFELKPLREGTLLIPEIKVQTDKGILATKEINITVTRGAPVPQQQSAQQNQQAGSDFWVEIQLNKSKVFVGEPVTVSYVFFSAYNPQQISESNFPKADGFWSEELTSPGNINIERKVVNGKQYYTGVARRELLFPQVSGKLEIEGFSLGIIATKSGGMFDFFGRQVPLSDTAPKAVLNVSPYPAGQPANFRGSFSPLSLSTRTDRTTLKANESINLTVTLGGNGNLKLVEALPFEFPSDFETFEPKVKDNITSGSGGMSGSRTFDYILIPRTAGNYTIPAVSISYFDYETNSYKTLSTETFSFTVAPGDASAAGNYTFDPRIDVQVLNQDIRHIKLSEGMLFSRSGIFFGTLPFYGLLALPALLFAAIVWIKRRRDAEETDAVGTGKKRAGKISRQHLQAASKLMAAGNTQGFYSELSLALYGYISKKLALPQSEMNRQRIAGEIALRCPHQIANNLLQLLDECELARFSAGAHHHSMNQTLGKAEVAIETLEQHLKRTTK